MKTFIACCLAAKAELNCRHASCLRTEVRELLYQAMYGCRWWRDQLKGPLNY